MILQERGSVFQERDSVLDLGAAPNRGRACLELHLTHLRNTMSGTHESLRQACQIKPWMNVFLRFSGLLIVQRVYLEFRIEKLYIEILERMLSCKNISIFVVTTCHVFLLSSHLSPVPHLCEFLPGSLSLFLPPSSMGKPGFMAWLWKDFRSQILVMILHVDHLPLAL